MRRDRQGFAKQGFHDLSEPKPKRRALDRKVSFAKEACNTHSDKCKQATGLHVRGFLSSCCHMWQPCQTCHMDSTLTAKYAEPQKQCCCHRRHHPTSSHKQPSTATETRKTEGQNSTNSTMTLHQFIAQVHPGRGRGFRAKSRTHAKSNSCPPSLLTYTRLHIYNIWPDIVCTCTDPTTEPIVAHPYTLGFASALASIVDPRGMASRNAAAHFVRAQNVHCRHPRRVTTSFTSVVAPVTGSTWPTWPKLVRVHGTAHCWRAHAQDALHPLLFKEGNSLSL